MAWETVIGLEIHAQLRTRSKIFSGAPTAYGAAPNTQACAIDLGYPGVLPVLNREAVRLAVKFGLAVGATVAKTSVFARKHYFYPDLPKGYQISQYDQPIVSGGEIALVLEDGPSRSIGITRAHLEEDAGKSLHEDFQGRSGIDLNRAGTPLLEIVSEPELRSAVEAVAYMRAIHTLVRYLDICDGNMQEGSFRCDANVSVRPVGSERLGTRTELKNLNSFRFVEKAIDYEVERQIEELESGGKVVQETRLYDADRNCTRSMRGKEEANDYRYFPDPDLLPLQIDEEFVTKIRASLPELPAVKRQRFMAQYSLTEYAAALLTSSRDLADYYERVAAEVASEPQLAANWILGELAAALNRETLEIGASKVGAAQLAALLARVADRTISGKIAKQVFAAMWNGEGEADELIERRGLRQITDAAEIDAIIDQVLAAHPQQLGQYRAGEEKLLGFFVGQVMKATGGKANPAQVNQLLKRRFAG